MPGAGELDKRIRFERETAGRDAMGGVASSGWLPLGTVWGRKVDASDGEKIAADQKTATLVCRFVVRSSTMTRDVTPKDRLICRAFGVEEAFEILGKKETTEGRNRFIEITAVARVDEEGL